MKSPFIFTGKKDMAFYNPFPVNYQPYNPYGQFQPQMQPAQAAGQMTPPTIRAEIVQIEDETAADRFPVNAGASQMFITRAEDKIIIKTMGPNGALPLDVYEKRPKKAEKPPFDPSEYIRKDELPSLITAILEGKKEHPPAAVKEAGKNDEPIQYAGK